MAMYCVLSAAGDHNTNVNPNDIIFTIKDTKLYVLVVFLSKLLIKDLNDQFNGMNIKQKVKI